MGSDEESENEEDEDDDQDDEDDPYDSYEAMEEDIFALKNRNEKRHAFSANRTYVPSTSVNFRHSPSRITGHRRPIVIMWERKRTSTRPTKKVYVQETDEGKSDIGGGM
ncbi:hypothetical protein BDN72DRAFT_866402 [Pluteus cervinus]|uniref:Uncharacterized protein n=1 Tax=Pluteus cervinus TaxID=181527 RepID=A0ACD2ZWW2_9AGAR|nr:hypothetical protein BDN72DRAFT_866402 [Pluteus cervinus]